MNQMTAAVPKKKKKLDRAALQVYSLAAIPLLLVFLFSYMPMFGIVIAFKDYRYDKGIFGSDWVGLRNFKALTLSNDFFKITRNTVLLNLLFIATGTAAALLLALVLYELTSRRATKIYQTILITPTFLSWVVAAYMSYAILHPQYGYLNQLIEAFGGEAIDWYSKPSAWPIILMIASIWKSVGMNSVIYYAALMGVDESLYESAALDGANRRQRTWYITLPTIMPLISIMLVLSIGGIFSSDFGMFYQLTRDSGLLYDTTDVISTYVYRTMRVINDYGVSSAVGLLQSVCSLVLVILANHFSKKIDPENGLF